jgi:hypothetical protein
VSAILPDPRPLPHPRFLLPLKDTIHHPSPVWVGSASPIDGASSSQALPLPPRTCFRRPIPPNSSPAPDPPFSLVCAFSPTRKSPSSPTASPNQLPPPSLPSSPNEAAPSMPSSLKTWRRVRSPTCPLPSSKTWKHRKFPSSPCRCSPTSSARACK